MKLILLVVLCLGNICAHAKPLQVGVVNFAPPFSSVIGNSNHYYGFCIDLMDELCARIQETCQYKTTELGQKQLEDLRQGIIDITFLTSPVKPTDNTDYIYSLPYLPSRGQFLVLNNSGLNTIDELAGKKIGVFQASELKNTVVAKYTPQKNIHEYTQMPDMLDALSSHQVDALLINASFAKYLVNNIKRLKPLGQPIEVGMGYGMIALKKNATLINRINKALLQIEADGTYMAIYKKYF